MRRLHISTVFINILTVESRQQMLGLLLSTKRWFDYVRRMFMLTGEQKVQTQIRYIIIGEAFLQQTRFSLIFSWWQVCNLIDIHIWEASTWKAGSYWNRIYENRRKRCHYCKKYLFSYILRNVNSSPKNIQIPTSYNLLTSYNRLFCLLIQTLIAKLL